MADKSRIFRNCSDLTFGNAAASENGVDQENRGSEMVTHDPQSARTHQQGDGQKLNVFERNYQYASIYENKRCVLRAKQNADANAQRHFKASPMPIVQPQSVQHGLPKFTLPNTPKVLKRSQRGSGQ